MGHLRVHHRVLRDQLLRRYYRKISTRVSSESRGSAWMGLGRARGQWQLGHPRANRAIPGGKEAPLRSLSQTRYIRSGRRQADTHGQVLRHFQLLLLRPPSMRLRGMAKTAIERLMRRTSHFGRTRRALAHKVILPTIFTQPRCLAREARSLCRVRLVRTGAREMLPSQSYESVPTRLAG